MLNKYPAEKYNDTAFHFDKNQIPKILKDFLQPGSFSFADLGCGDGPWFNILNREGYISPAKPVYAVDLEAARLDRVRRRFPWIVVIMSPADSIPQIVTHSLNWVFSTMILEHVPDEVKYLKEIARLLKPQGKAYVTTVYKRKWAWYFRKRNGESVLDTSHLREYTDLVSFRRLIIEQGELDILALELKPLWFPLLDPLLFRIGKYLWLNHWVINILRFVKVPIPGYYELHTILSQNKNA